MKKKIAYSLIMLSLFFISSIRFNISPSAPIGIYVVNYFSRTFNIGDYVIYKIPKEYKQYIPEHFEKLDTIKQICAAKGDTVYTRKNKFFLNNKPVAVIKYNLPIILKESEYILKENEFLTLSNNDDSVDGRYYGYITKEKIKYKAYLIWKYEN